MERHAHSHEKDQAGKLKGAEGFKPVEAILEGKTHSNKQHRVGSPADRQDETEFQKEVEDLVSGRSEHHVSRGKRGKCSVDDPHFGALSEFVREGINAVGGQDGADFTTLEHWTKTNAANYGFDNSKKSEFHEDFRLKTLLASMCTSSMIKEHGGRYFVKK